MLGCKNRTTIKLNKDMKNRLMPHCDANKRTIMPPKTIESESYSTILTVIITYYYCYTIRAIRITQGEPAGAVLWRRCAFHSGEISAKDNEIIYFLIISRRNGSRRPLAGKPSFFPLKYQKRLEANLILSAI
jgi:hypothetical protein